MPEYDINSEGPLKMIWAVREKIYEETKDMTSEEWSEYLRQANERCELELQRIRAEKQAVIATGHIVKKAWE